nr:C5 protein [Ludwigia yellow vein Vietnam virus]QIH45440.1 C5 protein [Ludwigia yellow vein Vietnam virus]QIH45447.1 C5 protein [Ludwigia yellow vein Vietnam virus]
MVLVSSLLLMVVNNVIVDLPELLHHNLFLTRVLTSSERGLKPMQHLQTITKIVLNSGCTGLIVVHVECLAEPIGRCHRTPIPN